MIGYELDPFLFSDRNFYKVEDILFRSGLNQKEFQEKIETLNQNFKKLHLRGFELKKGVLAVPKIKSFEEIRFGIQNPRVLSIHGTERNSLIYLLIFSNFQVLRISNLQDLLCVSRNTILSDIKKLKTELQMKGIHLHNSRKLGFFFEGDELDIRQEAYTAIQRVREPVGYYILSKFINQEDSLNISKISFNLKELLDKLKIHIVYSRFLSLLFFINLLLLRHSFVEIKKIEHLVGNRRVNEALSSFFGRTTTQAEKDYLLALLIGASDGQFQDARLNFLYRIGFQIMKKVMELTTIKFENFDEMYIALLTHLISAYFRIYYHFSLENELLGQIKERYSELFLIINKSLEPLVELCGEIPETELAYFVLLFGGEIEKKRHRYLIRAIVLCVNGISSSFIMKKYLETLFPNMEFVLTASIDQLEEIPSVSYDIIFSNIKIINEKKTYLMSPLPDKKEEKRLYNQVHRDFSLLGPALFSVESIMSALDPYLTKGVDRQEVIERIERVMSR